MVSNSQDEQKKDEVLQQINDALEKENWGGNCEQVLFKVYFNGKFNVKAICSSKKFDKS